MIRLFSFLNNILSQIILIKQIHEKFLRNNS